MKKDVLVFFIILFILFIAILFLPNSIPIHFNWKGEADIVVNRYFLLFGVIIPYSIYWKYSRGKKH
ncbi:DUF1648 domain-containing protein [Oceanobacillus sp. J11TS1]|uniref:DUF1648 domain-containing protein n=1 Tax=Oceanobacillus sp. J11TS1 TaxID=2807191 RepID=UPI001B0E0351|nr:DUF1648 domain-containing protein [Oceanobacillus sp. J11TS1]GIO22725.1 hypothetical protein J11TS1_13060 [Oceanobacillus sp. J11TS1]